MGEGTRATGPGFTINTFFSHDLFVVPFVDHCALGFYAIETESWPNQAPFLLQLRRRLEHMEVPDPANPANTVTALSLLRFVYTDTCCEGANDPTKHPIVDIFPHVLRAPYADGFHKTKLLLDACHSGAEQAMRTSFSRGIGAALRSPWKRIILPLSSGSHAEVMPVAEAVP